jgi:hypothetical protein
LALIAESLGSGHLNRRIDPLNRALDIVGVPDHREGRHPKNGLLHIGPYFCAWL